MTKVCLAILVVLVAGGFALPIEPEQQHPWVYSGMFEGDMVLQPDQVQYQGIANPMYRWPNGIMYYQLDPSFNDTEKEEILRAIEHYHLRTCLKILPRTVETNFVDIGKWDDMRCFSDVGMTGGHQLVNLGAGAGCISEPIVVHELLHAFGFHHQHKDPLRDYYIRVIYENIDTVQYPNAPDEFKKYAVGSLTDFGEGYDYKSIMHLPSNAFAKPNLETIVPMLDVKIGQMDGLSYKDVKKLHNKKC